MPVANRRELVLPREPAPGDLDGLDAIVHLAVAPHGASEPATRAVNVSSTVALYEAAHRAGVRRFIFVSSQSAHDGALNRYGRTKREAERQIAGRPDAVSVRPGLVYDGSDEGLLGMASAMAAKLRVFPVMGGRDARVQTIHMDDLIDTLLRFASVDAVRELPEIVELAEPTLWPLGELVASTSEARYGVRPKLVNMPLGTARAAARFAKAVKVGEAISEVVDGIVAFRPMDTAGQLAALGIDLRRFDAATAGERAPTTTDAPGSAPTSLTSQLPSSGEPGRLLLVGSGRIGALHALCASHHPDAVLVGIVDPARGAAGRVKSLVGPVTHYGSLDQALAEAKPTAAIVATPPHLHASISEALLNAGVDVLVEKPVTISPEDRQSLIDAADRAATAGRNRATAATGYHQVQLPHLSRARQALLAGEFGNIEGFCAISFVSRAVPRAKKLSWELDPDRAGGGALPQVSAHVMSLLDLFIGPLDVLDAVLLSSADRQVEDATWVHLTNGTVSGSLFAGWHRSEFVIAENSIRLQTDRGTLVVSPASAVFFPHEASGGDDNGETGRDSSGVVFMSCMDEPSAFDPAPNEGGAGFWLEQRALIAGEPRFNDLDAAERIERITNRAYSKAQKLRVPHSGDAANDPLGPGPRPHLRTPPVRSPGFVDVRRLGDNVLLEASSGSVNRFVVGTEELPTLLGTGSELIVVAPDIARAYRTATNEGPIELVRTLGLANLVKSGLRLNPVKALPPTGRIWEAFAVFLRAELDHIPPDFDGGIAIDGYVSDLAGALGRLDEIAALVATIRRRFPNATVGLDVNATSLALTLLPVVRDDIGFVLAVGAPGASPIEDLRRAVAGQAMEIKILVKAGMQPHEVVGWAASHPQEWVGAGSPDDLVVDWRGSVDFADANVDLLRRAIRDTRCPDWAYADACEAMGLTRPAAV